MTITRFDSPAGADGGLGPRVSPAGLGAVVLAHLGIAALLVSLDVVPRPTLATLSTLMVRVTEEAPQPRPMEPQSRPRHEPRPAQQPVVLAAEIPENKVAAEVPSTPDPAPLPLVQGPAEPDSPPHLDADYLDNPKPAYPSVSRRMGEHGKVVLWVLVEPGGLPSQVKIETSCGFPRLDQAAREAVSRWKFIPARQGDVAVAAWVLVPIVFKLKD